MARTPKHRDVAFLRDPDLPGIEMRYSCYNEHAFRRHTHQAYSVGLVETGRTRFDLEGVEYTASEGHLVVIEPGVVHACNPDGEMSYRMFYVEPHWLETVAAELACNGCARPVRFVRPVIDDPRLFASWRELYVAITENRERLEKESLLVSNIAWLLHDHAAPGASVDDSPHDEAVEKVREILATRLAENVTLDELAKTASMSRYHLLRVFQDATGLPPHAYQTQLRMEHAKRALAEGAPISQVALESGYADQSHFTRTFRGHTGATPDQYRNSVPYA